MEYGFIDKIQHAWNAFRNPEEQYKRYPDYGMSYGIRPDRVRLRMGNERSIINSIINRIGIDVAAVDIRHIRKDEEGRYISDMTSGLQDCLTVEANIDQSGRELIQDIVMSMCDEGSVAVVPVETTIDPSKSASYEIHSLRTGKILEWYPRHVRIQLYDDRRGLKEEVILPKETVAIIENPLYSVMNEPNSTLKRLIHKLNLLDATDDKTASGKLDLIIQLPYVIKTEARRQQAEQRRKDIEVQLTGSKYGIAYTDGSEKVIQLNRPAENNLMNQIEFLTRMLYSQLGLTEAVFNGTASEEELLNYFNRTIEPMLGAITNAMRRTFLTKTARTQGQDVQYFRDPFKLAPLMTMAELADKFTRNEITSPNEIRAKIGFRPVKDPRADELRNRNLNQAAGETAIKVDAGEQPTKGDKE